MDEKSWADQLINKYSNWSKVEYFYDAEGLGKEMAAQVANHPGGVYFVLTQLEARSFNGTTVIETARAFLDNTPVANLNRLAVTGDGIVLLHKVQSVIKCEDAGNAKAARCVKIETALAQAQKKPSQTNELRKLSQTEIDFYTERGQNQPFGAIKGGRVKGKVRRLFNPEVIWELPVSGTGYVGYNRNDINGNTQKGKSIGDKLGLDQIGTKQTIERIMNIAREWNKIYADRDLEIGDVARPGGINTTEHQTHDGNEFDVRAQSKSKTVGPLDIRGNLDYDRPLTKEFILLVVRLYPGTQILFNDSDLDVTDAETKNYVTKSSVDHYNHLHVILP